MKRIRRFLVLAMTLVMMMALSLTAYATDPSVDGGPDLGNATVTIKGLEADYQVSYVQIVEADTSSTTGWKFCDGIETPFDLAKYAKEDFTEAAVMEAVKDITTTTDLAKNTSAFSVSSAGLYLIKVTDETGKYIYKPMLASVGYEFTDGLPSLKDTEVVAKKETVKVVKEGSNEFVEINDILTYTVKASIPYIPSGTTATPLFEITDTLTGGIYGNVDATSDAFTEANANTPLKVEITYTDPETSEAKAATKEVTVSAGEAADSQTFTINLDSYTANNILANVELTITYKAKVTKTIINNAAIPTYCGHEGNPYTFKAVTGDIEITKIGDGGVPLTGAKFVIVKDGKYAQLDSNNTLTGWTTDDKQATAIETDYTGKATASGFDRDNENVYRVEETVAPQGYEINDAKDLFVAWSTDPDINVAQLATITVTDTTLSALPYTGGSGTAAFTGFGILIMSVAAGLYFANKNKAPKK